MLYGLSNTKIIFKIEPVVSEISALKYIICFIYFSDRIRNDSQSMSSMKKGVMRRTDRRMMIHRRDDDENPAELITCEQVIISVQLTRQKEYHINFGQNKKKRIKIDPFV